MSTIQQALRDKILEEFELPAHETRDARRPIFVAPEFFEWVDNNEDIYAEKWSQHDGGRSRFEHLLSAFAEFRCAERPIVGDLKRVMPTSKGIWKVQAPGVRAYGWVPAPHQIVIVTGALAEAVHGEDSITKTKVAAVLKFATDHGLKGTIQLGDHLALFP